MVSGVRNVAIGSYLSLKAGQCSQEKVNLDLRCSKALPHKEQAAGC